MDLPEQEIRAGFSAREELPEGWVVRIIGSLGDKIKAGGTPLRSSTSYWNGNVPFAKIKDITHSGGYLFKTSEFITAEGLSNSSAWLVPEGSVLLTMYGTIGVPALSEIPLATNQAILAIVPSSDVDKHFLLYALWKWGPSMVRLNVQSTQKNIGAGIVKSFAIPVPPLDEQRAVAHVLRTAHRAKEEASQVLTAARQVKQSLLQRELLSGDAPVGGDSSDQLDDGSPNVRSPAWRAVTLGDFAELIQYGTSAKSEADPNGFPVLGIPNVIGGRIDQTALKYLDAPKATVQKYLLNDGDLLFVRTNGRREYVGRSAVYEVQPKEALFASYLIRVRMRSERLLPEIVQLYGELPTARDYFRRASSKAADGKFNINSQTLRQMPVPCLTIPEQVRILRSARAAEAKVAAEERRLHALDQLFKSLLHELMTGKTRVKDLAEFA